jgi:hypothetical protein
MQDIHMKKKKIPQPEIAEMNAMNEISMEQTPRADATHSMSTAT